MLTKNNIQEYEKAARELLDREAPRLVVKNLAISEGPDEHGTESVFVLITMGAWPKDRQDFAQAKAKIVRDFRSWMHRHGDERFPYFDYRTPDDLKLEKDQQKPWR